MPNLIPLVNDKERRRHEVSPIFAVPFIEYKKHTSFDGINIIFDIDSGTNSKITRYLADIDLLRKLVG